MKIHHLAAATMLAISSACLCLAQDGQGQKHKGYPSREGNIDIRAGFAAPPKGYGNVPFYWWSGDSLRLDRLQYELDILSESATDGFAVSYNHTHAGVDTAANAAGHGFCGVPDYGSPRAFSDEWWEIWNGFSRMCAEKGMAAGMDDYTFAWPGNHDFMDRVTSDAKFRGYQGKLVRTLQPASVKLPEHTLAVCPKGKDSLLVVSTVPSPMLHPEYGQTLIDEYFQPFEDHLDARGREGMNYFFQDELLYDPTIESWSEDMPEQFLRRKGYDIIPHLPALFEDRGEESIRTRLDYAEVVTQLAEERFFKPIYDWHSSRGLIYGCDNMGRGLEPLKYMDYFRAISWFTAPGNDAPARGSSFTQTKVASSVAHLYDRPRTWLEAFHSMGWDANGAVLTHQLDHHIIAGGNLLCMHGLYYSTRGGWWEWAPPCFHFRMPYWEHMKLWLEYAQRMCFVLSQGRHVCDVAVLYPTETMQAIPGTGPGLIFSVAEELSSHGYDFDFIDYQSLRNAQMKSGRMSVAGEEYKMLVLADAQAMHESTISQIESFVADGGIVLALGNQCPRLDYDGIHVMGKDDVLAFVRDSFVPDFQACGGEGRVLHRRVGDQDVYMVMDVRTGDEMFFRSHGKVEIWDAMSGRITEVEALSVNADGTIVRFDGAEGNSRLVVFSPGEPRLSTHGSDALQVVSTIPVDGQWDVEVVPTMDNRWGDFRLPASDEMIGVEARAMEYSIPWSPESGKVEDVQGYGPYMMMACVDPAVPIESVVKTQGRGSVWTPYPWSWQHGVFDSPGSQGYHGLKGKVDSRFLILDRGAHQLFRTRVLAPSGGKYRIVREGVAPTCVKIDGREVKEGIVRLRKGWHDLFIAYAGTSASEYSLAGMRGSSVDGRARSMVMLYPESAPEPEERGLYSPVIASRWYGTPFLAFNPGGGKPQQVAYSFKTAPGTVSMRLDVCGKVLSVKVDGVSLDLGTLDDGQPFELEIPYASGICQVKVTGVPDPDVTGAAFFRSPVRMSCRGGRMEAGDWTEAGAMKYYSGGLRYSKVIDVDPSDLCHYRLNLGEVDATCEVSINGSKPEVLLTQPYSMDITDLLKVGANKVEVLVYSSLSNHYQTIPSPYRGTPRAGLIGPVSIEVTGARP